MFVTHLAAKEDISFTEDALVREFRFRKNQIRNSRRFRLWSTGRIEARAVFRPYMHVYRSWAQKVNVLETKPGTVIRGGH